MRLAITGSRAARASPTVSGAPSHTADGTTATSMPGQHGRQVGVRVGAGQLDATGGVDVREARAVGVADLAVQHEPDVAGDRGRRRPANWKTPLCQTPAPTNPITSGRERSRGPRSRPTASQIAAADGAPSGSTDTISRRQPAVDQHVAHEPGHGLHLADPAGHALDHLEAARRVAAGVARRRRTARSWRRPRPGRRTARRPRASGGCARRSATGCAA